MEYNFILKYQIDHGEDAGDSIAERLGGGGCDDALLGLGQPGRIALNFCRQAKSAEKALLSALSDVKAALPEAVLIEAAPDFVGLSDVADSVGVTRQNLRKLMLQHHASFPLPSMKARQSCGIFLTCCNGFSKKWHTKSAKATCNWQK